MTTYATDWWLLGWYVFWTVMLTLWAWSVSYFGALFAIRAHDEESGYIERLRYESIRAEQDRAARVLDAIEARLRDPSSP